MRLTEIEPIFIDEIPNEPVEGKLYISDMYKVAVHLCACGCGQKTVTPLGDGEWYYTALCNINAPLVTLRPSIGNFKGEKPYHAHYFITNNKIEWLPK